MSKLSNTFYFVWSCESTSERIERLFSLCFGRLIGLFVLLKIHFEFSLFRGVNGLMYFSGKLNLTNRRRLNAVKKNLVSAGLLKVSINTEDSDISLLNKVIGGPYSSKSTFNFFIPLPWQADFISYASNTDLMKKEDRQIIWIVDEKGRSGKLYLSRYLNCTFRALICRVDSVDGLRSLLATSSPASMYVIDIARATNIEMLKGLAQALEELKDGLIQTTKYKGKTLRLPRSPIIIVFANCSPVIEHVTYDR